MLTARSHSKTKTFLLLVCVVYCLPGLFLGVISYVHDLKSFVCSAPGEPHGQIGMSTRSFANPDPEICDRKGAELKSALQVPFALVFGTPMIVARYLSRQKYMSRQMRGFNDVGQ